MVLIYCTESCIHQDNGFCTFNQISSIKNTTSIGCEYFVERKKQQEMSQYE